MVARAPSRTHNSHSSTKRPAAAVSRRSPGWSVLTTIGRAISISRQKYTKLMRLGGSARCTYQRLPISSPAFQRQNFGCSPSAAGFLGGVLALLIHPPVSGAAFHHDAPRRPEVPTSDRLRHTPDPPAVPR